MKIDGKGVRRLDCRQAVFLGGQFCREERGWQRVSQGQEEPYLF